MENLNEEQIKKALECCENECCDACENCPSPPNTSGGCVVFVMRQALALITEQEQRIEELTSLISRQRITMEWLNDKYRERTEENERLREDDEIATSKRANIFEIVNAFERGRADGARKMLQRIKEDAISVSLWSNPPKLMFEIREDALDQIAKELEGDDG